MIVRTLLFLFIGIYLPPTKAAELGLPATDYQQINYWLPHKVANHDVLVNDAQQIFNRLLQTWNPSRVEPSLIVVNTEDRVWAASLADGHVLVSYAALKLVRDIEPDNYRDALAFILAHELSHQQNDDLWHQRFFRITNENSNMRTNISSDTIKVRYDRELQADQDGLLMMAISGFRTESIIKSNNFFTSWIEHNKKQNCNVTPGRKVCQFALLRADNLRKKISHIIKQNVWYELGLFLLAAKQYNQARMYFLSFARDYPHWLIYNTIASSYLLEALSLGQANDSQYYLALRHLKLTVLKTAQRSRSASKKMANIRKKLLEQAQYYLNKSEHMQQDNPNTLYLISLTYLLNNNLPMSIGVLEGKMAKIDNNIPEVYYLRALINIRKKNYAQAIDNLNQATVNIEGQPVIRDDGFSYAIMEQKIIVGELSNLHSNTEVFLSQFIQKQNDQGNSIGFRWGLAKTGFVNESAKRKKIYHWSDMNKVTPSPIILWLKGEPYQYVQKNGNYALFTRKGELVFRWCDIEYCAGLSGKESIDTLMSSYGYPDDIQYLASSTYLTNSQADFIAVANNKKIRQLVKIPKFEKYYANQ